MEEEGVNTDKQLLDSSLHTLLSSIGRNLAQQTGGEEAPQILLDPEQILQWAQPKPEDEIQTKSRIQWRKLSRTPPVDIPPSSPKSSIAHPAARPSTYPNRITLPDASFTFDQGFQVGSLPETPVPWPTKMMSLKTPDSDGIAFESLNRRKELKEQGDDLVFSMDDV